MDYEVVLVEKSSNHNLAKYVKDDEEYFVVRGGDWWLASNFFVLKGEIKFKIIE